jgi:hypothetical protein
MRNATEQEITKNLSIKNYCYSMIYSVNCFCSTLGKNIFPFFEYRLAVQLLYVQPALTDNPADIMSVTPASAGDLR